MSYVLSGPIAERLAIAVSELASHVLFISDTWSGGELPLSAIENIARSFHKAKDAAQELQQEATKLATRQTLRGEVVDLSSIEDALGRADFTPSLVFFEGGVVALEQAASAWNDEVSPRLSNTTLPVRLESVVLQGRSGNVETRQLKYPTNLPESEGLAIKNSTALANLKQVLIDLKAI